MKSIAVINPGFSVDCIETLEEIAREARRDFHHAGGKNFAHIPCLNDSAEGMDGDRDDGAARAFGLDLRPIAGTATCAGALKATPRRRQSMHRKLDLRTGRPVWFAYRAPAVPTRKLTPRRQGGCR